MSQPKYKTYLQTLTVTNNFTNMLKVFLPKTRNN